MNNALYTAYLGMRARQRALDVISNNIANASTTGFKADQLVYSSIEARVASSGEEASEAAASNSANGGAARNSRSTVASSTQGVLAGGATDFSTGAIRQTGRSLDLALSGDGFLVVQTARGERYTRAGTLTLNDAGQLVTPRGELVVGDGGPITLPPGEVSIGEDGQVSVGEQSVGKLKIVRFADPRAALTKEGDSLFAPTGAERPLEAVGTRVVQGAVEGSNVNAVGELAAMMKNGREFDSLQRSVTLMMNDLGRKVATEIGRL